MEEQKVIFETAKLAKEKGFDIPCENYYDTYIDDDDIDLCNYEENRGSNFAYLRKNENDFEYSAPTQALLQKWLRETYDIHIDFEYDLEPNMKTINVSFCVINNKGSLYEEKKQYLKYEQALEQGLQKALKLI